MSVTVDTVIRNGLIYDGSGGAPFNADIAIKDGVVTAIGDINAMARLEIDAKDCIVTPGFVDIHTHYDGQMIWSNHLRPSSCHGVTTVLAGNCGVGFAPCRPADRQMLVNAMEGVEDIPEVVMTEGLSWDWESFPEFLNAVERTPHDINIALLLPHSALRIYVMGSRGANREIATDEDIARMKDIVAEAMEAGAFGVATSLVGGHRRADGEHIPSYTAGEKELVGLAAAIGGRRNGLFQLVPELAHESDEDTREHIKMLENIAREGGLPVTFTLLEWDRFPGRWQKILEWVDEANAKPGVELRPQIFPRPVGMLLGHQLSNNPFFLCPSYAALSLLPFEERIAELKKPEVRERLLREVPEDPTLPLSIFGRSFDRMFVLGNPPNYEQPPELSVAGRARALGITPEKLAYDLLLEDDGTAMLYVGFVNFGDGTLDFVTEMMKHPDTIVGLGDGGAHYRLVCDASYSTFLLTHWTRDRRGDKLPLAKAIQFLTSATADLIGLHDRGRIAVGCRADMNVIDYDRLTLHGPEVCFDLPAGGLRLHQAATGYRWTLVNGEPILRDDESTGSLPGKLIRGRRDSLLQAAE